MRQAETVTWTEATVLRNNDLQNQRTTTDTAVSARWAKIPEPSKRTHRQSNPEDSCNTMIQTSVLDTDKEHGLEMQKFKLTK